MFYKHLYFNLQSSLAPAALGMKVKETGGTHDETGFHVTTTPTTVNLEANVTGKM